MKLLLDTHVLLWWWLDSPKLTDIVRREIAARENEIIVSSATAWEIATKQRLGKLPEADIIIKNYEERLQLSGMGQLAVNCTHALLAGQLDIDHRDPFDRMLMAQAMVENMTLATYDPAIQHSDLLCLPSK